MSQPIPPESIPASLFAAWLERVQAGEDEDFEEMCRDYEEVRSLLATWTTSTDVKPADIDKFRTLLKELEVEIVAALQTRFQDIKPPDEDVERTDD